MGTAYVAGLAGLVLALGVGSDAHAQLVDRKGLTLAEAKKIVAAAQADAAKSNLTMAIAVVDEGGHLLLFEKMDGTQTGSVNVAIAKARSAALFKRPTKVFEDAGTAGRTVILSLHAGLPLARRLPIPHGTPLT